MKKGLKGSSVATKYHYFNLIVRSAIFITAIIFLGIAAGNGLNYCKYAVAETRMIQQIQG